MWIFDDDIWRWHVKMILENNIWRGYLTSHRSHMWDSQEERACWYNMKQVFLRFYPPAQQGLMGRIQKKRGFQYKNTDQSVTFVYSNIFVRFWYRYPQGIHIWIPLADFILLPSKDWWGGYRGKKGFKISKIPSFFLFQFRDFDGNTLHCLTL